MEMDPVDVMKNRQVFHSHEMESTTIYCRINPVYIPSMPKTHTIRMQWRVSHAYRKRIRM